MLLTGFTFFFSFLEPLDVLSFTEIYRSKKPSPNISVIAVNTSSAYLEPSNIFQDHFRLVKYLYL